MRGPILLIHGFTDTGRTWDPLVPELRDHHELLVPTLVGHRGGPPVPAGMTDPIAAMADGLERVLDDAGVARAHLHGNSLGGWLAFELAARGRALTVVATSPGNGWEGDAAPDHVRRRFARANRLAPVGARFVEAIASRPGLRRIALGDLIHRADRLAPATAAQLIVGAADCAIFDAYTRQIERGDYRTPWADLGVPVRIAWGDKDRTLPRETCSPYFRMALPDAEWVDLPGCGHLPHHDDPGLVARTVLEVTGAVPGTRS